MISANVDLRCWRGIVRAFVSMQLMAEHWWQSASGHY